LGSLTWIVRVSELMMPEVTVGPPSRARAYPMATTRCPSSKPLESPRARTGRSRASSFSTARSRSEYPPMTRAG
jgi:hypothetical protein